MKIGMCRGFTIKDGEVYIEEYDIAKTLGFDYFEIGYNALGRATDEEFEKMLKFIEDNKIPVPSANLFAPAELKLTGEEKDKEKIIAYCKKTGERARKIGIKKVVMGSGGARNRPNGYPKDKANKELEESVRLSASILKDYGVTLIAEHLNHQDSNILNLFSESCELARKCDNVMGILDTFHFQLGNEDLAIVKENEDVIGHIHFARLLGRAMPHFEDIVELEEVMQVIKDCKYDDLLSFECKFENLEENQESYRKVVEYFKKYYN